MSLYAFKSGVSVLDEAAMNSILALQPFDLLYEGSLLAGQYGAGVVENSLADYGYCARFTLNSTEISRVELEVDRDNAGADLTVQIRSGMNPAGGIDGTLLKQVLVPKEFIPTAKTYWSVPINLAGLGYGGQYWLAVLKNGDSNNKLEWIGEVSQDGNYPAYQRGGASGAWSIRNALHFKIFSGESGRLIHGIYGGNGFTTVLYNGEYISGVCRYLPDAQGGPGIRNIQSYVWSGEYLKRGVIT